MQKIKDMWNYLKRLSLTIKDNLYLLLISLIYNENMEEVKLKNAFYNGLFIGMFIGCIASCIGITVFVFICL